MKKLVSFSLVCFLFVFVLTSTVQGVETSFSPKTFNRMVKEVNKLKDNADMVSDFKLDYTINEREHYISFSTPCYRIILDGVAASKEKKMTDIELKAYLAKQLTKKIHFKKLKKDILQKDYFSITVAFLSKDRDYLKDTTAVLKQRDTEIKSFYCKPRIVKYISDGKFLCMYVFYFSTETKLELEKKAELIIIDPKGNKQRFDVNLKKFS